MTIVSAHTRRVNGKTSDVTRHEREMSGRAGEFAREQEKMMKDRSSEIDQPLADELELTMINDGDFYNQRTVPILKNLGRKHKKGIYDSKLAQKLWMYAVDDYARKYSKEWLNGARINVPTRQKTAQIIEERYRPDIMDGTYDNMP